MHSAANRAKILWSVMSMMKKRETVEDGLKVLGKKRKKIMEIENMEEGGVGLFEENEVLCKPSEDTVCNNYSMHGVSSSDSNYYILRKILPHEFLMGTLRRRVEDREGGLPFNEGCGKQGNIMMEKAVRRAIYD
eukprot:10195383-Ditylum_brightwellii.AAC.2